MSAITDLLDRVTDSTTGRPVIGSLAAPGKAIGAPSINLNDTTNWTLTTGVHLTIYKTVSVAGVMVKDPTTQTDWKGTLAGTTISNLTLTGGTDRAYSAGDIVELTPTARWAKDLYDAISAHTNQDGSLKTSAVQTALNLGNTPAAGWTPIGATPVYTGNNGQKEFTMNFPIDLTATLSKGMKLQLTRATAAPTQSMAFAAASSQYATKAAPAGLSFTAAFSCEAWVYLSSYTSSGVISRSDGTNGWYFGLTASGQVKIGYENTSAFTEWNSAQSLPLNRWVHIAGVVSSTTGKTLQGIYINGISVPTVANGASAAALTQAGALQVGAVATGSFFNGYISEGRVWSAVQTAANILANMAINLTGSEANLVALFKGNGNFNDSTANANTLTATNGAIATQAVNPYNNVEYCYITNVGAYAGGNTPITVFCGTDYTIPNMVLGSPQYSNASAPFGFPRASGKWIVEAQFRGTLPSSGSNAKPAWYKLTSSDWAIPTGDFNMEWSGLAISLNASAGASEFKMQLDTAVPAYDRTNVVVNETKLSTDANFPAFDRSLIESISNAALTTYSMYGNTVSGGGATSSLSFDSAPVVFRATLAYL